MARCDSQAAPKKKKLAAPAGSGFKKRGLTETGQFFLVHHIHALALLYMRATFRRPARRGVGRTHHEARH